MDLDEALLIIVDDALKHQRALRLSWSEAKQKRHQAAYNIVADFRINWMLEQEGLRGPKYDAMGKMEWADRPIQKARIAGTPPKETK